jgi:hypothetical protein
VSYLWKKVNDTIISQNQTYINEEAAVHRVVRIQWRSVLTNLDNMASVNQGDAARVSQYFS